MPSTRIWAPLTSSEAGRPGPVGGGDRTRDDQLPHPKRWRHRRLITEHAFDKLGDIDCTLAELEVCLEDAVVIEEGLLDHGMVKELVLVGGWSRPLHVAGIVSRRRARGGERVLTIYEPDPERWSSDYRTRR